MQASIDVDGLQGIVRWSRRESNPVKEVRLGVEHGLTWRLPGARGQQIGKIEYRQQLRI